MWQSVLSSGILTPNITTLDAFRKYSFELEEMPDDVAEPPSFVLVPFDKLLLPPKTASLRPYLLGDETSSPPVPAKTVRERGLHVRLLGAGIGPRRLPHSGCDRT